MAFLSESSIRRVITCLIHSPSCTWRTEGVGVGGAVAVSRGWARLRCCCWVAAADVLLLLLLVLQLLQELFGLVAAHPPPSATACALRTPPKARLVGFGARGLAGVVAGFVGVCCRS